MDIRPVRTKADYRRTLKEIETLMDAVPNTTKGERLDVLVALVEAYERKHYPLDLPDPVEAIRFRMDLSPLTNANHQEFLAITASRPAALIAPVFLLTKSEYSEADIS